MKITQYMKKNEISQGMLAKKLGTHQSVVSRWVTGGTQPSFKAIQAINRVTKGKVSFEDWPARAVVKKKRRGRRASKKH
jgi:DNA-binding transcriptional regulator YdaS (Cro superfamily)